MLESESLLESEFKSSINYEVRISSHDWAMSNVRSSYLNAFPELVLVFPPHSLSFADWYVFTEYSWSCRMARLGLYFRCWRKRRDIFRGQVVPRSLFCRLILAPCFPFQLRNNCSWLPSWPVTKRRLTSLCNEMNSQKDILHHTSFIAFY